ncbi:MAG: ferritin-like domain-containing protein [Chitinophagaceae bacterium]
MMIFKRWKEYYEQNRNHFAHIDLDRPDELTAEERAVIASSLQQFQRGEHSEGKHLYAFAQQFGDQDYLDCIRLFIPEEQRHAMVLAAYMKRKGIPLLRGHWVDNVFRWLRQLSGIENTVRVLLVAEIIAKVYYQALFNATSSGLLKDICKQILKDEDQHILFQCDALRQFQRKRSKSGRLFFSLSQAILMTGTAVVVWWHHRKVLYRGGYDFRQFFKRTLAVFTETNTYINQRDNAESIFRHKKSLRSV